ncbi:central glycolytic genes regulator [Paenibacillus swuensis]|uniref:Central glycolytic genes regulator n=1 Tax=Paenibacillus swuensis TaxID=1178515 RepID=A0A172TIY0_9BACL|nr:sugar-binding domain-containing protein [Paenibacillus swuensis]ANE46854.1 central glycolytic genes regulator [Paenibacillus swuensis]
MRTLLNIQKQLLPDMIEVFRKRYRILHYVMLTGSVGRRTLASALGMTERVLRAEVDFLNEQGLVEIDKVGIRITDSGEQLVQEMDSLVTELFGLTDLEERIRQAFNIKQVIIVPGDADVSPHVKRQLGQAVGQMLRKHVKPNDVIGVTGGSTLAEAANQLGQTSGWKGTWFVPARGGLGESMEFQANTIASMMAKKTGAGYRLLHVPDNISEEAYQSLMLEPNIQDIVQHIRKARIVIHGIGDAMSMARRRRVGAETVRELQAEGALAEAFGYYFDREGKVVHKTRMLGLRLEDIQSMELVIAVAGGTSKAEAILSVLRFGHQDVLITDEGAALAMVKDLP